MQRNYYQSAFTEFPFDCLYYYLFLKSATRPTYYICFLQEFQFGSFLGFIHPPVCENKLLHARTIVPCGGKAYDRSEHSVTPYLAIALVSFFE